VAAISWALALVCSVEADTCSAAAEARFGNLGNLRCELGDPLDLGRDLSDRSCVGNYRYAARSPAAASTASVRPAAGRAKSSLAGATYATPTPSR
jgi:hypothetical protein